ncbi:MAG TPA: response regulator [Roseiflexaceae bacterium]|nr:response regulator [Roseiflexaceae bacterium]
MILLVDADQPLTDLVQRHLCERMPHVGIVTASNGLQALALAHVHAPRLRVVVLDVALPLMDGRVLAAAVRRAAPGATIVPFTEQYASLAFFAELGSADPILKPALPRAAARAIVRAYAASAQPLPQTAWFTAMCAQADTLVNIAAPLRSAEASRPAGRSQDERLLQAQALLQRYLERSNGHGRGREIAQSLKLIEQCLSA